MVDILVLIVGVLGTRKFTKTQFVIGSFKNI